MSLCPGFNATYGCAPNKVPGLDLTCGSLTAAITPLGIPGEPCSNNTDCWSDVVCINGICVGRDEGSECSEDQECDVNMFCNMQLGQIGKCAYQLSENYTCYSDFQCANSLGCNGFDFMNPGICTPYYSLPNGSPSTTAKITQAKALVVSARLVPGSL